MIIGEKVFGSFEKVSFPDLMISDVIAKVDTGAFSGAVHCDKIKETTVELSGKKKKVLKIIPSGQAEWIQLDKFKVIHVRSASGHRTERYIANTKITIKGKTYPIRIGLADRSDMKYEVLIGRRFLGENNILVDVRKNQDLDIDRTYNL